MGMGSISNVSHEEICDNSELDICVANQSELKSGIHTPSAEHQ